jgi:glycosyltransferase involved in cell wall biosynthesis
MKLLVVSSWFPYPPTNGSKLRAYNLLARLADCHAITLLSFAEPGEQAGVPALTALCERVVTVSGNPFKREKPLRVRQLFAPMPRSLVQTYSRKMQALVDAEIGACDAALAFQLGAALYLRPHSSVPRILDEIEIGVFRDNYRSKPIGPRRFRRGLTWWKYARFVRNLVAQFDRSTVVSERERDCLAEAGCDIARIAVVPNGVDRSDLTWSCQPKPGTLIYPGAVTYSANLDAVRHFVGEILPRIRAVRPVSLQVTGATGNISVADLTAGGAVRFTGYVDDVKRLVAESCVCIVPLRIGGGTRLKILESMALGTPVVSTSKGAEGLEVTHEEDILIADTPQDFARQTMRLLDDPDLRARLATNARRTVERQYTWDRIGAQLSEIVGNTAADRSLYGRTPVPKGIAPRAQV